VKIIELHAENFKRLKAVTIEADGTLQVVAGRNAQGKSSVLDAIWWVLQQRGAAVEEPVRHGEATATVRLTFEEFVITRTTSGSGAGKLTITSRDGGASYSSPQKMLDGLVGKLSLDPLAFANADAKRQVEMLLQVVDLGFDPAELARKRKAIYDTRTDIGRERDKAKGLLGSIPEPPADTPEHEVSAAELAGTIQAGDQIERDFAALAARHQEVTAEIARLQAELVTINTRGAELQALRRPDLEHLRQQLVEVDEINARVRLRQQREHAEAEAARLAASYDEQTGRLDALDGWKASKLAAAAMPVAGLGLDDEHGVTYNGVPISQASGAERLRISTGIAMAASPDIRVIRITDGSLMDSESMALIAQMAAERDFQCWVERVGTADGIGVVIEDGEVA